MMWVRGVCLVTRSGLSWSRTRQLVRPQIASPASIRSHQFDARDADHEDKLKELTVTHGQLFERLAEQKTKDRKTFQTAIQLYLKHQGIQRRGHVEFIYASLEKMKEFGVNRDLEVYKQIISILPKDKMVCTSIWETELMHYPKQQQCLIDILDHMESNGVVPDNFVGNEIVKIFGINTYPFRKYQRMMYWLPKFKHANPYALPYHLPDDTRELARLALGRMAIDLENKITEFNAKDFENIVDETFVMSAQSPGQRELITDHPADLPLYVEGAFLTWLRDIPINYFVLRGKKTERLTTYQKHKETGEDPDAPIHVWGMFEETKTLVDKPSLHEQEDGTILGMCITGTGSKDSLATWIKALQVTSPKLSDIPIVFLLRSPVTGVQIMNEEDTEIQQTSEQKNR